MTRPQIIRADTLDLQDHDAPSAKDHSRQPETPEPLGGGRPAPHQELSIRNAEQESQAEIRNGPDKNNAYRGDNRVYREPDDEENDGDDSHYDHEDGDLADGESDDLMDDDMDKLSSSPSIDDEDIDFEFVYALHNFVATVDGQANAAKGDTMVLLDDSNSYWWLVRVVKDGSIGYLPAEHIETPTERLARLNKHRNVDLSATMLGDNNEKSKNPLKKAMRRRNAKTVNFGPPTYIEASDVEYSTDDDSEHGDFFNDDETLDGEEEDDAQEQAEDIVVEPLRTKAQKEPSTEQVVVNGAEKQDSQHTNSERRPSSEEFFEAEGKALTTNLSSVEFETHAHETEPTVSRSRNGTVRNTDSFFKDDTAEPKKISLTPNLLRDIREGESNSTLAEWKEPRASLESLEKGSGSQDKVKEKDEKKRKDKKPGMLSGEVSCRTNTHITPTQDVDGIYLIKILVTRTTTALEAPEAIGQQTTKTAPGIMKIDPVLDPAMAEFHRENEAINQRQAERSLRQVPIQEQEESGYEDCEIVLQSPISQPSPSTNHFATPLESRDPLASPVDRPSSEARWKEPNNADRTAPVSVSVTSPPQRFVPNMANGNGDSESPGNVSPVEGYMTMGMSGLDVRSLSPPSPPSSSGNDASYPKGDTAAPASLETLSVDTPTWSDSSLRSYLDEENDIRDLFIIVHDKSNVPPAGPDHPVTGRLFKEESKRLKEMNNQLDEMLVNWMAQRAKRSSTGRG
ncbi:hypothetical protein N7535_000851 [Penicillium sp. DV-2018c]|nr:hypothetical protein N7535_000851 [Penicillium sp. DV-2018c]